jgi:hypothetical protein
MVMGIVEELRAAEAERSGFRPITSVAGVAEVEG